MRYNFTNLPIKVRALNTLTTIIILTVMIIVVNTNAFAGGKPVGRKRLYLVPTIAYFVNTRFWENGGPSKPYANNGSFTSIAFALNSEYGLSRRVSLMAALPFALNQFKQTGLSNTAFGPGDAQVGIRYYFANINYNVYFSVQGNVVVPLYQNTATKQLGYGEMGTDIRFYSAGDFGIGSAKLYYEGNAGVREYYGTNGPFQISYTGSLSYILTKKSQVSVAASSVFSHSDINDFNPVNLVVNKDYSYTQLTAGYSYSIKRNKSIFASAGYFVTGKNTGVGSNISIGYLYKY